MRVLIYLLAMLTGFSAAEAARPVVAVPASVDAKIGQAYAAAAVAVTTQAQVRPIGTVPVSLPPLADVSVGGAFFAIVAATPVLRHDVILG